MGGESIVVRRGEHGWRVGDEQAADLISAMALADLLAADLGTPAPRPADPPRHEAAGEEAASGAQARPVAAARPVLGQLTSLVLAGSFFGHAK